MTKKVLTVYGMLFLFAFTFAFAFTLVSTARADGGCCIYELCDDFPPTVGAMGHWVYPHNGPAYCEFNGTHLCDWAIPCPDPDP